MFPFISFKLTVFYVRCIFFSCVMRTGRQYTLLWFGLLPVLLSILYIYALLFLHALNRCLSLNFQSYFYVVRATEPNIVLHEKDIKLIIPSGIVLISYIGHPASNVLVFHVLSLPVLEQRS